MKYTLNKNEFIDWMRDAPYNSFSYEALELLWDYLTEDEDDMNETEFDPADFRGRFSESSFNEIISENNLNAQGLDAEADKQTVIEFLNQNAIVLGVTEHDTIVYQNF
jgi:hypothetical protein